MTPLTRLQTTHGNKSQERKDTNVDVVITGKRKMTFPTNNPLFLVLTCPMRSIFSRQRLKCASTDGGKPGDFGSRSFLYVLNTPHALITALFALITSPLAIRTPTARPFSTKI
jgi:hypothetical protein